MALRILQFGVVFAIGFFLGPAAPFAGAIIVPQDPPLSILLEDPKDVTVGRGQSATLRCNVNTLTANHDVQISWLHNEQPIASNDTKRYIQSDGSLYIQKVGGGKKYKGLTGEYRCSATSRNLTVLSSPAKLRVASFGDFGNATTTNLNIPESQPVVIFCNINSFPSAQIQWERNTVPLPHNTRYVPLPTGALLITNTHSSDAGLYRCIATNSLLKSTKRSKIVELKVSARPTEAEPPSFLPLGYAPNSTVLLGQNTTLYCAVNGWPFPTVQWLNNNSIVISNSTLLHLKNVTLQNAGNYTCVAYNSGGRISRLYQLEVHQKPYFNVTPVSKVYPPARTVRLDCQALGVPKPKILWLKNGKPLSYNVRIKKTQEGLVISHSVVSDFGMYQCVAINTAGRIWAAAQLQPAIVDTPSPPEEVQCRPFDDKSICINWKLPEAENVMVKAYSVNCYYTANGIEMPGAEFVTNDTQLLATGLNSSTNYSCNVRLYANIASGEISRTVTCITGTKGSRNLQISAWNESAVQVAWSKISSDIPCDSSKRILYKVQWKRKGISLTSSNYTSDLTSVISGLAPFVEYEFRVMPAWIRTNPPWQAYTLRDLNRENVTVDLRPLAPENVNASKVTATEINLTWVDHNENTKFYEVCVDDGCEEGKNFLKTTSTSLLIGDLKPNSSYGFKVKAHNFEGQASPFSQLAIVRTRANVPSQILNLRYKTINESTVCLYWQAPLHKNGKLSSYLVSYTPNFNWPLDDWYNKSVDTMSAKECLPSNDTFSTFLIGLEPQKEYSVYVRAMSEVGLGNPNYPIKINTKNIKSEEQPLETQEEYNQNLGLLLGVTISLIALISFISCGVLFRKRCLKARAFARAPMTSQNYYPGVAQYASEAGSVQVRLDSRHSPADVHEIEHLVKNEGPAHIPPDTPAHLDTKGSDGLPNGHINGSAKPHANGHVPNGIHITENPRYYAMECNGHTQKNPYEEDSNSNVTKSKFYDLHRIFETSKPKSSFKEVRPNG